MSSTFPTYLPTSRVLEAGNFAVTSYESPAGLTLKNKFSDRPKSRRLSLTYKLTDDQCQDFYRHYNNNYGTVGIFQLPTTFTGVFDSWCGTSLTEDDKRRTFSYTPSWSYAAPIQQEQLHRGLSQLTISLIQVFGGSIEPPAVPIYP